MKYKQHNYICSCKLKSCTALYDFIHLLQATTRRRSSLDWNPRQGDHCWVPAAVRLFCPPDGRLHPWCYSNASTDIHRSGHLQARGGSGGTVLGRSNCPSLVVHGWFRQGLCEQCGSGQMWRWLLDINASLFLCSVECTSPTTEKGSSTVRPIAAIIPKTNARDREELKKQKKTLHCMQTVLKSKSMKCVV